MPKEKTLDIKKMIKEHPIEFVSMLITLVSLCFAIYFGIQNHNLNKEKNELEKPILLTPDLRVEGNSASVSFPFYIKNPSDNEYYVDLTEGTCSPKTTLIKKSAPERTEVPVGSGFNGDNDIIIERTPPENVIIIPPHDGKTVYCQYFDVYNPIKDTIVEMDVCIKEKRIKDPICGTLQINILKT